MNSQNKTSLSNLDRNILTPLVRQSLNSETVEVIDWSWQQIHGGAGEFEGVTGVYRFSGTGEDQNRPVSWSLILKGLSDASGSQDPTLSSYWKREALAYESSLLTDLPGELTTPRCFGVTTPPPTDSAHEEVWIWLEDIKDETGPTWPPQLMALAARYLGQFNGAYLHGRPLPTYPWLSQGRTREWVESAASTMAHLRDYLVNPFVRAWLAEDMLDPLLTLWAERESYLAALKRLPHTLCHHDAFRRNLLTQYRSAGQPRIVAIDWSYLGTGAIGEEIATLVAASLTFLEVEMAQVQEFEKTVFDAYLAGLNEAGWQGDSRQVRFGYAATAAMLYGIGVIGVVIPLIVANPGKVRPVIGHPPEKIAEQWSQLTRYLLHLGDEARELLNHL